MSLLELHTERTHNPVDVVERLAALHDWAFDRAGDDEIANAQAWSRRGESSSRETSHQVLCGLF